MTSNSQISYDKLVDVHINNLNNIQSIIHRISNIGYTLFTICITICSIIFPLIYTLNINLVIRIGLTIALLILIISLFISHLINLKNEKIFRYIYLEKTKLDINNINDKNKIKEILFLDFKEIKDKKNITILLSFKSWLTISWMPLFILNFVTLCLVFFI